VRRDHVLYYRNDDKRGLTYVRWLRGDLIISFREGGRGPLCIFLVLKRGFIPAFFYAGTFLFGRMGPDLKLGRP
jgi:hypothetical protein